MTIQTVTITYDDDVVLNAEDPGTVTTTDPNFPVGGIILFNENDVQMQNPGGLTNKTVLQACGTIAQQTIAAAEEEFANRAREYGSAVDAVVNFDGVGKSE